MKIYTLGTSCGSRPIAGSHHFSTALEVGGKLYFIDAGECCGYTAHLCGADLLNLKAVFITHPHMDHVGGLGNLLWYVRKLATPKNSPGFQGDNIDVFVPTKDIFDATMLLLKNTEGNFRCRYSHTPHEFRPGRIYEDENIAVTAVPTKHIVCDEGTYLSYSFTVEAEGKVIVFSGDMELDDIAVILPDRCDAFFTETGHHIIEDIAEKMKSCGKSADRVFFTHNGSYILNDKKAALERAGKAFDNDVFICSDGEIYEL